MLQKAFIAIVTILLIIIGALFWQTQQLKAQFPAWEQAIKEWEQAVQERDTTIVDLQQQIVATPDYTVFQEQLATCQQEKAALLEEKNEQIQQSSPTPQPTPQPTPISRKPSPPPKKTVCDCSRDTYNCKNFRTHAEAQACFEYCGPRDVHKLDKDKDGIACESLP